VELDSFIRNGTFAYNELLKEKELLQELNYIFYYPGAANGDIFFIEQLEKGKKFLSNCIKYETFRKESNNCAFLNVPIDDLRIGRSFKRHIQFYVKAGIIKTEPETYEYLRSIKKFCFIIRVEKEFTKRECMNTDQMFDLIYKLEDFMEKFKEIDKELAKKYLFSIEKIKKTKVYKKQQ